MLFPPILNALRREFSDETMRRERKVLLPGCGLARLAYEISLQGELESGFRFWSRAYITSRQVSTRKQTTVRLSFVRHPAGKESDSAHPQPAPTDSHFMNLGISLIFQHTRVANQYEAAPYLHSFSHHRSSEKMLRTVSFPDVVPDRDATLTFTPGDFLELYRAQATHDAVVTLFFIDTVLSNFSLFPASAWD